jgi:hypothetical protein
MKTRKIISHPVSITSAAVVLFVAAVLIATPYLIGSFMQSWIESQGQLTEQVDDIDFNPFTGTLVLHNLQVETASGRSLEIPFASARLSWPHLMNKQVYLKDWTIQDAYLVVDTLEGKRLRVAGLILEEIIGATDETSTSEWAVGIGRFQILNSRVIYNTPELEATYHIDRYQLTGLESWDKENAVVFELKGKINTSPVHIKAEVTPFAPAPVWKGNVKLQKGDLSLLSKVWGLQDLNMDGGINGDLDLEAVLQEDNIIDINAKGSVNINQLKIRNADIALSEEHIAWEGTVSAKKLPSQGVDIMAEGRLTSGSLDVNILSRGSHLQLAGYTWQGKTQFRQQGDSSVLSMEAELEGGNTSITDTLRNLKLLQFNKINIQNIAAQSLEDIHISTITLQKTLILAHGQNEEDAHSGTRSK